MFAWTLILAGLAVVSGLPVSEYDMSPGTIMAGGSEEQSAAPSPWKVNEQPMLPSLASALQQERSQAQKQQQQKRVQQLTQENMPFGDQAQRLPALLKNGNLLTIWKRIVVDCKQQPWLHMEKLAPTDIFSADNFQNLRMIFRNCFMNKDGIRF